MKKRVKIIITSLFLVILGVFNYSSSIVTNVGVITKSETMCDKVYAIEMEKILNNIKSLLSNENQLIAAKNYMILIKQRQDIDDRIIELENKILPGPAITRLRLPLNQYSRCRMGIATVTY